LRSALARGGEADANKGSTGFDSVKDRTVVQPSEGDVNSSSH
jgi:hypothetical protein